MKRKIISFIITGCIVLSGLISANVSAEETPNICTVIGVSDDSVFLNNGCKMEQEVYQKHSGETNILKCGDVISIGGEITIVPLIPGYYHFAENSYINYLGTAADYYGNIKELTVIKNDDNVTFEDSEGNPVIWQTQINLMEYLGYKPEIDPRLLKVGDKLTCSVKTSRYYAGETLICRDVVAYPVIDESNSITESTIPSVNFGTPTITGDIDLNNEQGTADIIVLSKYIANSQLYPITDPTALANADMNQDKEVNSLDANILVEMTLADYENIV